MSEIRVCIVEDDRLIREAFTMMLGHCQGIRVTGVFGDAEEFLRNLNYTEPDVVLMDIQLPGISGLECIRKAKALSAHAQFMICSVFEDEENIFEALRAGANGYLMKNVSAVDLERYIRDIHEGLSPMSGPIARKVIGYFRQPRMMASATELLSPREQEILELLSRGFRYKEVADKLYLSPETVRTHIRNVYSKLQVDNRTDAINKVYGR